MSTIKHVIRLALILSLFWAGNIAFAEEGQVPGIGQTVQIITDLKSFVGRPSWTIIVRDIDNNVNLPYVFDVSRGNNFWIVLTYGHNYLITSSNMQISTYRSTYNDYQLFRLDNFCHLESNGRIIRGESLTVRVRGNLTANSNTVVCDITRHQGSDFVIADDQSS